MKHPKTILITGATAGIGRQTAKYLAGKGHRVIATGRRPDALEALADEAKSEGLRVDTVRLDVTDSASIQAALSVVDRLTDRRGVDVLVNNAGYGHAGPLELVGDAELRAQFDTNVFGLMAVTRAFLPRMRARGWGRVINIGSIGGRVTFPFLGAYHATKYAVEALSDALRVELAAFGIGVVVIEPGPIESEFSERAMKTVPQSGGAIEPYAAVLARGEDYRRLSDSMAVGPEHVARAVGRAVDARRPAARYVVPFQARFLIAAYRWIPVALMDAILRRVAGLTPEGMRLARQPAATLRA